jgi:general secretion pathway protein M
MIGRAAAVAILAVLIGLAWLGPVDLYLGTLAEGSGDIAAKQVLLQRYRALAGVPVAAAKDDSGLLFPEIPEAQAVALLQETVKSAAAAARVEVRGLQVLRQEAAPGAARIGIRVSAAGDIAGLGRLLYAVEAARPLLYPDNLHIQARAGALEFQLDISGFKAGAS